MNWKAIAVAGAAAAAATPALAQGDYMLRNDTAQTQNCRLERPHRTVADRFVLRPGEQWAQPARGPDARRLVCDIGMDPLRAMLRPGPRYALVLDRETGRIVVRVAAAR